jgi:hypothetical protein
MGVTLGTAEMAANIEMAVPSSIIPCWKIVCERFVRCDLLRWYVVLMGHAQHEISLFGSA